MASVATPRAGHRTRKQLRNFGLTVGIGFGVLGALQQLLHGKLDPRLCYGIGAVLVGLALAAPGILRPIERGWMALGNALGHVMSRVFLGVVYFGLFAPIALTRRLLGIDGMSVFRRRPSASYWVSRMDDRRGPERYERQF